MARTNEVSIVEVAEGFVCPAGQFNKGQLFAADDPLVRKSPHLFRPVVLASSRVAAPAVEQATAAPGEKRGA